MPRIPLRVHKKEADFGFQLLQTTSQKRHSTNISIIHVKKNKSKTKSEITYMHLSRSFFLNYYTGYENRTLILGMRRNVLLWHISIMFILFKGSMLSTQESFLTSVEQWMHDKTRQVIRWQETITLRRLGDRKLNNTLPQLRGRVQNTIQFWHFIIRCIWRLFRKIIPHQGWL